MQDKIKIDLNTGLKIEMVHPLESGSDIIDEPCLGSFYKPKWLGEIIEDEDGNLIASQDGEWVEGATPEEIEELTKVEPQPQNPSEVEMLHAQIKASNDYMDFLEEVIVEMAQMVYE